MAAYYILGVEHPSQYKPLLYFFQDMVMDKAAADNGERPTRYASLVATITVKWNSTCTCLHFISMAIALVCLYKHVVSHILLMVILKYMYVCTFSLIFSHLLYSQHSSRTLLPYLPEYKSQLQHLFLLLISRVRLILRMFRILHSISRTESETSPLWTWSRMVVQRMRKCTGGMRTRWRMHARKRRWRSG